MSNSLPLRLIRLEDGKLTVFETQSVPVDHFEIISYTWGDEVPAYSSKIVQGISWEIKINEDRLKEFRRFMIKADVKYLWADCLCINQGDDREKAMELGRMYQYYKTAFKCHILMNMDQVWKPQEIVDNLKFIDHVLSNMEGAALASEAFRLTENLVHRLSSWANETWSFDVDKETVRSAAIDMGVLNCYSTCINQVKSVFDNAYFSRVWTFQEMILGKQVTMWGVNSKHIECIGELQTWMDLATDSCDKSVKLRDWIHNSRKLKSVSVNTILGIIIDDHVTLSVLQKLAKGINSARTDIVNGGPIWWHDNYKGISNVFSAISIRERRCTKNMDVFRGLLGIFSGLFTPDEIERDLSGDDIARMSFTFFQRLSNKTGRAWTKLAVSNGDRGEYDWIPVVDNYEGEVTTQLFAGVINLGLLSRRGQAKANATTGLAGSPRKFMDIQFTKGDDEFNFKFKGCNCGKKVKTGLFQSQPLLLFGEPRNVVRDETGRVLVQCATILACLLDPGSNSVAFRKRLLETLGPHWNLSDINARPVDWIHRCVSGTPWEHANPSSVRVHNMSMNYKMVDIIGCESRLANGITADISCKVVVNCGCEIVAPFSFIFEAISAIERSSLGGVSISGEDDDRIILTDGLGLIQIGDIDKNFKMVAFGGDINFHKTFATSCRKTRIGKPVIPKTAWPTGRALVRKEFNHDMKNMMRDYGYVNTGGSGNPLICRNHVIDQYKIVGVCIDGEIANKKGLGLITIR
jgi:hypothetical protein